MQARRRLPAILVCLFAFGCGVSAAGQLTQPASLDAAPIAIVPVGSSATVTGALQVTAGKAMIATAGTITSGAENTQVVLPRRGTLKVCASTAVKLTSDASVPAGEAPGLMLALDSGAVEASFAAGRNSDILITPDFRILIGGPGAAELKVRLGARGDTCVDNPGPNAPYVLVSSVFDGGAYRVQPGQRVMFQHGSLKEVVDNEKESCGCPPDPKPDAKPDATPEAKPNEFPLAQSAGLTPAPPPVMEPRAGTAAKPGALDAPLVYQAPKTPEPPEQGPQLTSDPKVAQPSGTSQAGTTPPKKSKGFFRRVGGFFRRIFGGE